MCPTLPKITLQGDSVFADLLFVILMASHSKNVIVTHHGLAWPTMARALIPMKLPADIQPGKYGCNSRNWQSNGVLTLVRDVTPQCQPVREGDPMDLAGLASEPIHSSEANKNGVVFKLVTFQNKNSPSNLQVK